MRVLCMYYFKCTFSGNNSVSYSRKMSDTEVKESPKKGGRGRPAKKAAEPRSESKVNAKLLGYILSRDGPDIDFAG